jgi:opacity protein-like surface antigen
MNSKLLGFIGFGALGLMVASTISIGGVHAAESSTYVGVSIGKSGTDRNFGFINPRITTRLSADETDRVSVATAKIGKYLTNNVRADIELGYLGKGDTSAIFNPFTTTTQSVETRSLRLMANVAYDVELASGFKIYPMAGIGFARNTSDGFQTSAAGTVSNFESKTSHNIAWSVGAGVSLDISDAITLDLSVQHLNLGNSDTGISQFGALDEQFTGDLTSQEIKVGIRYKF